MKTLRSSLFAGFLALVVLGVNAVQGGAVVAGFNTSSLAANDDGSTGSLAIGFSVNYFGTTYTSLFANNNGNVTFGGPLSTFTPFGLSGATSIPIIAAFFADVDTRGDGSDLLRYGSGTVGARPAFGVTWDGVGVGYFSRHVDKLNEFQLLLVDRSDIAAGDFDIYFNYDKITWETGDASGGTGGLGGSSARVGYSNGTGAPGSFFELGGSGVNGAFLDTGPAGTSLIRNEINTGIDGSYLFTVRSGIVTGRVPDHGSVVMMLGLALAGLVAMKRRIG